MHTTITAGNGKAIHWGSKFGTICGAGFRNGWSSAFKIVQAETATCGRCIKLMAAEMAEAELQAHAEAAERVSAQAKVEPAEVEAAHAEALEVEEILAFEMKLGDELLSEGWEREDVSTTHGASLRTPEAGTTSW